MFGQKCKAELKLVKSGVSILREANEELKVKLLDTRIEGDRLRAEIVKIKDALNDTGKLRAECAKLKEVLKEAERVTVIPPLDWTEGEPKEQGWYFVAWKPMPLADTKTTALFYNPAARCKWMRGEKGNAERFEQEVIAYIEAPEYE